MIRVAVIGGGAAGLMAALMAAKNGAQVTLFEKNEKLGKKIYITGKGRCNVTNTAVGAQYLANVMRNPKFLMSSLSLFDSAKLCAFLEELGLPLKVERGGRVFPASDKASDVTATFARALSREGVDVRLNSPVSEILACEGSVTGLRVNGKKYDFDRVIVCTGGVSYPSTGSTGDGYRFAGDLGHSIVKQSPSLVPIDCKETWPSQLQGLTLKNVNLSAQLGKKTLFSQQGEMLFTHFGITGPLVLSLSAVLSGRDDLDKIALAIDLKPALDEQTLEKRILRDFDVAKNKQVIHGMVDLLPQRLIGVVLACAGIDEKKVVHQISRVERESLLKALKSLPLTIKGLRGWNEAVVTRGGVSVREVDPKTMASKKIAGLYFAGEVLDVDALTGGYNLQIAFTTGYCAGLCAARKDEEDALSL